MIEDRRYIACARIALLFLFVFLLAVGIADRALDLDHTQAPLHFKRAPLFPLAFFLSAIILHDSTLPSLLFPRLHEAGRRHIGVLWLDLGHEARWANEERVVLGPVRHHAHGLLQLVVTAESAPNQRRLRQVATQDRILQGSLQIALQYFEKEPGRQQ